MNRRGFLGSVAALLTCRNPLALVEGPVTTASPAWWWCRIVTTSGDRAAAPELMWELSFDGETWAPMGPAKATAATKARS